MLDRLSVLYKYRWASITVFLLVVGWVMVDSYTKIPIYRAQARVLIEDPGIDLGTPQDMMRNIPQQDPETYMQTQLRIMQGRDLAQRVARRLDLSKAPEFNGRGPTPTALAQTISLIKYYASWPYRMIVTSTVSLPDAPSNEPVDPANYGDALLARFGASTVRGSQLVDMTYESSDAEFAAQAVNAYADEYVAQNLALKVEALENSAKFLTAEVARQQKLVQQSETNLALYRERNDASGLEGGQNITGQRLNQLNDAVTRAKTERIQKESLWKQIQAAGQDVDTISSVVNNTFIQSLKGQIATLTQERTRVSGRYGPQHPEFIKVNSQLANVQSQLDAEIKKALVTAKNEYDAAVTNERVMTESLNEAKSAASALSRKGVDYSVMQREAETNREIYNQLLTREKEIRVLANSRTNNVRVVDRADVPGSPFTPNHRSDWMYAIAFGLVLGIGIAVGLDYMDDTVKTPEDLTRRLKLRFLGLVPSISSSQHPLISGPVPHDFGEAYRSIRTALASQITERGPKIVLLCSSQPLEGKTTTSVNIAISLALGGARVLLIDADMRRPSVHKAMRMPNDRGLSQLLAGQARMREVVQRTHDPNLLAITAGRTPANPSELLASDRMRALISGLRSGPFDWVIIDSPPVLAVTDAVIIAPLVSAVAFVVGSEMTRWRLAERAIETMLSSNPAMLLAILNKVDFGRNKYYYSRYYGHQYKNYYNESPAA
ncbi:MAG TPA: polysaccharide biosynthesis tyrosine autokinase [Vicinamibacterales bacterium]|nr:polysaccharide biosynthesis tyrosine autokinase [Vicinamibacterales bacterium]